jgi:hypothetical protein
MTLSEWIKILNDLEFKEDTFDYVGCELSKITLKHENETIGIFCCYSDEYLEYVNNLPKDTEFVPDYNKCEVESIQIFTKEFAYPIMHYDSNGKFKGCIELGYRYDNFNSLTYDNFIKALWMSRNPIEAKLEIVEGFISEVRLFLDKHGDVIKKLNLKEVGNSLLKVGDTLRQTEPYIAYLCSEHDYFGVYFEYNIFTGKLILKQCKYNSPYDHDYVINAINVNDITSEELETEIKLYIAT